MEPWTTMNPEDHNQIRQNPWQNPRHIQHHHHSCTTPNIISINISYVVGKTYKVQCHEDPYYVFFFLISFKLIIFNPTTLKKLLITTSLEKYKGERNIKGKSNKKKALLFLIKHRLQFTNFQNCIIPTINITNSHKRFCNADPWKDIASKKKKILV